MVSYKVIKDSTMVGAAATFALAIAWTTCSSLPLLVSSFQPIYLFHFLANAVVWCNIDDRIVILNGVSREEVVTVIDAVPCFIQI